MDLMTLADRFEQGIKTLGLQALQTPNRMPNARRLGSQARELMLVRDRKGEALLDDHDDTWLMGCGH